MADFSFLELSYDPAVYSTESITDDLNKLGFIHRSQHKMDQVGFWNHRECIFLLRKTTSNRMPYISGLGMLGSIEDINTFDAKFDGSSDFFKIENSIGIDTYIIQENQIDPDIENSYTIINSTTPSVSAFKNFTGIKLNVFNNEILKHFSELGFSYTDVSDNYSKFVSPNKKFTIMCSKANHEDKGVPTLLVDTHDVFKATAFFVSKNLEIPTFDLTNQQSLGKLDFKINAYNCKAWGNEQSYTIENFLSNVFSSLDIIVRQRKQYLHIQETTLDSYYANETR